MIISTTYTLPNSEIIKTLGITKGCTVRTKPIGKDLFSKLKSIVRGERKAHTALLNKARKQIINRMIMYAQNGETTPW